MEPCIETNKNKMKDFSYIKTIFAEVKSHYECLNEVPINLIQRKLKKTTMRAQPYIFTLLKPKKNHAYKVEFSNNTHFKNFVNVMNVPENVLKGWFAHELGHIVDYQHHSFLGMIWFAIKYFFSDRFKVLAERRADLYAIQYGLTDYILDTKKYIIENSNLSDKYKTRIKKYYLTIDDVHKLVEMDEEKELRFEKDIL